jgi:rod shape-determining protein MreD
MARRPGVVRFAAVMLLLVALQFLARPRLGDPRIAPDFLLVALLFLAIRTRPAVGAAAGFLVGLAIDALAPTAFGAAALAFTVTGFMAGWIKSLVFADNYLMTSLFVLVAAWLRDAIQTAAANQLSGGALGWQLLVYSPLAALTTAAAALVALLIFRQWLGLRAAI